MAGAPTIVLTLYGPGLVALLLVIGMFKARGDPKSAFVVKPLGSFVDLRIPMTGIGTIRLAFCCGIVLVLSGYIFLDYSSLFPHELKMEVFFDHAGLDRSLEVFTDEEKQAFRIPTEYESLREQYFGLLDGDVRKILGIKNFFGIREGTVHSAGRTSFIVEKTAGIQNYHIAESVGELTHVMEVPRSPTQEFLTIFQKQNTKDDYLNPTLRDLFITHTVVLRPFFKQLLAQDRTSKGVVFRFAVVGATKVYIFPWPRYSNTVYLADFGDKGLVPVGYAIYH